MYNNEKEHFEFQENLINNDIWKWKLCESVGALIIINGIITLIPFVPEVDKVIRLTTCFTALFFIIRGIGEDSLLQRFIAEIKFKKNRKVLHLRSAEYVRKERKNSGTDREDQSVAEYYIIKGKKIISKFLEDNTD